MHNRPAQSEAVRAPEFSVTVEVGRVVTVGRAVAERIGSAGTVVGGRGVDAATQAPRPKTNTMANNKGLRIKYLPTFACFSLAIRPRVRMVFIPRCLNCPSQSIPEKQEAVYWFNKK